MPKEYNVEEMGPKDIYTEAVKLLVQAGMDQKSAEGMLALSPGVGVNILENPAIATTLAENNPSEVKTAYDEYNTGFNPLGAPPPGMSMAGFSMTEKPPAGGFQTNEQGVIRYNNGVIYDPELGKPLFPPNDPEAIGSEAWLVAIQTAWDASKIQTWRKRLNEFGYDLPVKGDFDLTFKNALRDYHYNRYANGGTPIKLDQAGGITKRDFGGALDPAVLGGEVEAWFEEAYGDRPSEDEKKFWTDKLAQTAKRIARQQGLEPGAAVAVSHARTQEAFREDPEVQEFARQEEEEEENTELRDSLLSVAQIVGM